MVLTLALASALASAEVRGQIDWQAHPAMHISWRVYGPGLTDGKPPRTHRHAFQQTVTADALAASGVRIFSAAAMAAEKAKNPDQARALILDQLDYVEAFVAANPDRFVLARSPEEARQALETTDKMVVVHAIEGGRMLLSGPEDARFWAERGVSLVTVIHLLDDELGGSASNPGLLGWVLNRDAARKRRRDLPRGLTERGKAAIVELDRAGILVDLTHMSPEAVQDALAVTRQHDIPPVVTHGKLWDIHASERGFRTPDVIEIYRQGGVFNLALSGTSLNAMGDATPPPGPFCDGSIDSFLWYWTTLQAILDHAVPELFGVHDRSALSTDQRTRLATGWASDWNGGIGHTRPKHGRRGCDRLPPGPELPFDTLGLAHPGLLPDHWQRLEEAGADLDPMLRSAERFLQLWERARTPVEERQPAAAIRGAPPDTPSSLGPPSDTPAPE